MKDEKKTWLIEQYAHKAWTTSLALMQEAARAGDYGKGYAVIALEARTFANKLFEYAEHVRFDGADEGMFKGLVDFAAMVKFLSVNAMLEIIHMVDISMDFNIPKTMSVFAEELRHIAVELIELTDGNLRQKPFIIPELASPSESSEIVDNFFLYAICGYPLVESLRNMREICYPLRADTEGEAFSLRGYEMPLIDCYKRFDLGRENCDTDRQTVMIINPDGVSYGGKEGAYAVPIDELDVNAVFYTRIGRNAPLRKEHAFSDYVRECWDVVGGDQVVFVDWKKLI